MNGDDAARFSEEAADQERFERLWEWHVSEGASERWACGHCGETDILLRDAWGGGSLCDYCLSMTSKDD